MRTSGVILINIEELADIIPQVSQHHGTFDDMYIDEVGVVNSINGMISKHICDCHDIYNLIDELYVLKEDSESDPLSLLYVDILIKIFEQYLTKNEIAKHTPTLFYPLVVNRLGDVAYHIGPQTNGHSESI